MKKFYGTSVIGNPVKVDVSYTQCIRAMGETGTLNIPFNTDIMIVTDQEIIMGTFMKKTDDGYCIIIDNEVYELNNRIRCISILGR